MHTHMSQNLRAIALAVGLLLPVACDENDGGGGDDAADGCGSDGSNDDGNVDDGNVDDGNDDDGNNDDGNVDDGNVDDGNNDDGNNDDGNNDDGNNDDGNNDDGAAVGEECMGDADCASQICLFAGNAAFGFCSEVCDSFADCPDFWNCEEVGGASATYCVPPE